MNSDIFILLDKSFHTIFLLAIIRVFIFILSIGAYLSSCESFNYQSSFYPQLSIFILAMIKCRDSFTYLSVLFEHANMVSLLNDETFFH